MGLMSQRYIPYCCLVYMTEQKNYLSKIIKCDEELILKKIRSIDLFRRCGFVFDRQEVGFNIFSYSVSDTR